MTALYQLWTPAGRNTTSFFTVTPDILQWRLERSYRFVVPFDAIHTERIAAYGLIDPRFIFSCWFIMLIIFTLARLVPVAVNALSGGGPWVLLGHAHWIYLDTFGRTINVPMLGDGVRSPSAAGTQRWHRYSATIVLATLTISAMLFGQLNGGFMFNARMSRRSVQRIRSLADLRAAKHMNVRMMNTFLVNAHEWADEAFGIERVRPDNEFEPGDAFIVLQEWIDFWELGSGGSDAQFFVLPERICESLYSCRHLIKKLCVMFFVPSQVFETEYTAVEPFYVRGRVQRVQRRLFEAGLRRRHRQRAAHTLRLIAARKRYLSGVLVTTQSPEETSSGIHLPYLVMALGAFFAVAAVALVLELVAARIIK